MKTLRFIFFAFASLVAAASHAAVDIQHWVTSTGARVYFVENHDLPILDLSVSFPAGSARDRKEKAGVAGVTRYMMALGAAGMNEENITNQFADIGARKGGEFGTDIAAHNLRTLTSEKDKALIVFNKILHQPDFPQAVLDREKTRIVAGLQEAATQPGSIASKAFKEALYRDHPYGFSSEVKTIVTITREDLQVFYKKHYTAKSAVISLIGDITQQEARGITEDISSGLPQTSAVGSLTTVSLPTTANVQTIPHPASQAHVLLGSPGVKRGDADYFPLYVGNYVLGGGGFVSRLTEEVREKRGLVYSVYSFFAPKAELGPFQIGFQTKKEQADEALKVVNETLENFINKGITKKELKAAKSNIIGGFPMRIDSNRKILGYLNVIGFYRLPLTYLEDFNKEVAKVTAKQIKDAFQRRVKTERFVTVIVGAASE